MLRIVKSSWAYHNLDQLLKLEITDTSWNANLGSVKPLLYEPYYKEAYSLKRPGQLSCIQHIDPNFMFLL